MERSGMKVGTTWRRRTAAHSTGVWRGLLAVMFLLLGVQAAEAVECGPNPQYLQEQRDKSKPPALKVTGTCTVRQGTAYYYGDVNILEGGTLLFVDNYSAQTEFWASSIIIENEGAMIARGNKEGVSYGTGGSVLSIYLYGQNKADWDRQRQEFKTQNQGALCQSGPVNKAGRALGPCGIFKDIWDTNGNSEKPVPLPGKVEDFFYQYGPLYGDALCDDNKSTFYNGSCRDSPTQKTTAKVGYFGNKVLAVSFGATLDLAGFKGATDVPYVGPDALDSGTSWMRLKEGYSLEEGETSLFVERPPGAKWMAGDEIVVTTTDYLPGHSEKLRIKKVAPFADGAEVEFETVDSPPAKGARWRHNGTRYGGPAEPDAKRWTMGRSKPAPGRMPYRLQTTIDWNLLTNGAETRAAVALLSRSIRIMSGGDKAGDEFPAVEKDPKKSSYSYGGHMVIRQGFKRLQVSGVEFVQMGQGGRLGHYPVHFHMARKTPFNTYIKDSSINESMTRWIVLHSTQGVWLGRNVGYKSIGHGFYLEDGTETDNRLYSNIGIFARAAVDNPQNPRKVPGILADNEDPESFRKQDTAPTAFPYRSDIEHPTVFWIANGWNDFIGNMAAGAGACGTAYWLVPSVNRDHVEVTDDDHKMTPMKWSGYAGLQKAGTPRSSDFAGTTPLRSFYRNYATSMMFSFQTTGDAPPCHGIIASSATPNPDGRPTLKAVPSDAPTPAFRNKKDVPVVNPPYREPDNLNDHYYPQALGGSRFATTCPGSDAKGYDCSGVVTRCQAGNLSNCAVTVIDRFTSSFHWAEGNVSAIWLRPQWYLLTNSVISDIQNGGLTFITGGDYTHASIVPGYWAVARNSIFIGNTNPNPDDKDNKKYKYTSNAGPFNAISGLKCDAPADIPDYCLNAEEGVSMPVIGFFTNQRLSNIYDGPSYQDSNAYLDIKPADCPIWRDPTGQGCMYGKTNGVLRLKNKPGNASDHQSCYDKGFAYLPNAGIAWKQPNGFYYPPAFHSRNLFFSEVDLRHYVINPPFQDGTYLTNEDTVKKEYCTDTGGLFNNWTSIDRQTELTDDDGTLTGLSNNLSGTAKQTISVNDDSFFNAPLETAECASATGENAKPKNACTRQKEEQPATAKTSPYEYVSTVVYHKSTDMLKDPWDPDCSNPSCYGIPLYRQLLTPSEMTRWNTDCTTTEAKSSAKCRFPFIRMAGAKISQRQTMTINNGVYYLDTTVSRDVQQNEEFTTTPKNARLVNVFTEKQTYFMFFLYARRSTVQTYLIYVGEDFMKDPNNKEKYGGASVGRMKIASDPLEFDGKTSTPGITFDRSRVSGEGLLTVKIDFSSIKELDPTPDNLCQPKSFCKVVDRTDGSKQCVRAVDSSDSRVRANRNLLNDIDAVCANWAVKDLDCPAAGCLGFSVTLPEGFPTGHYKRPNPGGFPAWTTKFTSSRWEPDDKESGQCFYDSTKMPVSQPCSP